MKVTTRTKDGVTILDLDGKLIIGVGDVQLREAVREAIDGGARKLLLNMEKVLRIDSCGVGELVSAYTRTTNYGGQLKLVKLPPKIQDLLQITQLITIFEYFDDENEAVASF